MKKNSALKIKGMNAAKNVDNMRQNVFDFTDRFRTFVKEHLIYFKGLKNPALQKMVSHICVDARTDESIDLLMALLTAYKSGVPILSTCPSAYAAHIAEQLSAWHPEYRHLYQQYLEAYIVHYQIDIKLTIEQIKDIKSYAKIKAARPILKKGILCFEDFNADSRKHLLILQLKLAAVKGFETHKADSSVK